MKRITECPLCCSANIKHKFKTRDRLYGIPGEFNFFVCKNCGLIFQNPQLSDKELAPYYPKEYVAYDFKKDGRNNLISLLYKTYHSEKGNPILKFAFLPVRNLLRSMPKKINARYLDIGCGSGNFLRFVKENKMQPHGVDPFLEKPIKELNIKNTDLFKAKYPSEYFDFITLNNVLEHVPNPLEVLKECNRILKRDGKIFVNVPNSSSLNYHLFSWRWVSLELPRHLFIYSNKTLNIYGKKAGLKIERFNHKSEPFTILGSLEYLYNSLVKRENPIHNSKFIANPIINLAVMPLSLMFNFLKIGDQTEVVYVKND